MFWFFIFTWPVLLALFNRVAPLLLVVLGVLVVLVGLSWVVHVVRNRWK
jgi:hypothetical protein